MLLNRQTTAFKATSFFLFLYLAGCQLLPGYRINLLSAERSEFFLYENTADEKKLSDINIKYTGSQANLRNLRSENPHIKADKVEPEVLVRIPSALLKSAYRSTAYPELQPEPPTTNRKQIRRVPAKAATDQGVEILPSTSIIDPVTRGAGIEQDGFEIYDENPYEAEPLQVVPSPAATVDPHVLEEQRLRDKYRDIMQQLD